jgi:hypothetical protein
MPSLFEEINALTAAALAVVALASENGHQRLVIDHDRYRPDRSAGAAGARLV